MNFHVMTLFPEMIEAATGESIIGRARENGSIRVHPVNIRDYAFNKHSRVDDYPYGGGAGMLMQAEPVYRCYEAIAEEIGCEKPPVIYLSPQGKTLTQAKVEELAGREDLILLCGHYEGIDQRVLDEIVTEEISVGDYVLTGGELPALILIDAVSRMIPGVLHNDGSTEAESFNDGLLEYPQYTRPEEWHGRTVPEVLLSGHHANVEKWRCEQQLITTARKRPDLLEGRNLSEAEQEAIDQALQNSR